MFKAKSYLRILLLLVNLVLILVVAGRVKNPSFKELGEATLPTNSPLVADGQVKGESYEVALVTRAIDGDTIEISGGKIVRYIGIDAPEVSKGEECFSDQAKRKNEELVLNREVELIKDISETDKYGRLLRYVYLNDIDGDSQKVFVNDYLVREGFAKAANYPPDETFAQEFKQAEREAFEENKGLWKSCNEYAL